MNCIMWKLHHQNEQKKINEFFICQKNKREKIHEMRKYYVKISLIHVRAALANELFVNVHDDVTQKSLRVNLFIIHKHTFAKLNI